MVKLFYTTYINVDLAHHEIFRAKVGKGGIKSFMRMYCNRLHAWWSAQSRLATLLSSLIVHWRVRPQTL